MGTELLQRWDSLERQLVRFAPKDRTIFASPVVVVKSPKKSLVMLAFDPLRSRDRLHVRMNLRDEGRPSGKRLGEVSRATLAGMPRLAEAVLSRLSVESLLRDASLA